MPLPVRFVAISTLVIHRVRRYVFRSFDTLTAFSRTGSWSSALFLSQLSLLLQALFQAYILFLDRGRNPLFLALFFNVHRTLYYLLIVFLASIIYVIAIDLLTHFGLGRKNIMIVEYFMTERWANTVWSDCGVDQYAMWLMFSVYSISSSTTMLFLVVLMNVIFVDQILNVFLGEFLKHSYLPEVVSVGLFIANFAWLIQVTIYLTVRINFWISVQIGLILTFIVAFRGNRQILQSFVRHPKLSSNCLGFYLRNHHELIQYLLLCNGIFAKFVSWTMAFYVPTSILLLISTLDPNLDAVFRSAHISFAVLELLYLLVFHAIIGKCVGVIAKPSKLLYHSLSSQKLSTGSRRRIVIPLEQIHSKHRIGFSYSELRLITLLSYFQFVFRYQKLVLLTLRALQNNSEDFLKASDKS